MSKLKFEFDDAQKIEAERLYTKLIEGQRPRRELLYSDFCKGSIWNNALIASHYDDTQTEPEEPNKLEKKLMQIIKDILIFPELYLDIAPEELEKLYAVIDAHKEFEILFTSHGNRGPKTHGTIAIGCTSLQSGMAISGAGDRTRIKMELPKEFLKRFLKLLKHNDVTLNEEVQKQFGNKEQIIAIFEKARYFDSRAINILLSGCVVTPNSNDIKQEDIIEITKQFNSLIFKFDWKNEQVHAIHQELWTKPRSAQQFNDTKDFNKFYLTHLTERDKPQGLSALLHPITRRVAFRQQLHVKTSTALRNFLYFEQDKVLRDKKRSIDYKFKTSEIWTFGSSWSLKKNTSQCVGFATRLMGAIPAVGSIINRFSRSGLQIPLDSDVEKQKEAISNFLKIASPNLCFSHLNQNAHVRDDKHNKIAGFNADRGVVFDSKITKFFAIGLGPVQEHVWGTVVTDGNGILLPKEQWKFGWISKEKVNPSPIRTEIIAKMIGMADAPDPNAEIKQDPRLERMGAHVTLREPYNEEKFTVSQRPAKNSLEMEQCSFKEGTSFMLGSYEAKVQDGKIYWNGHEFNATDYKGRPILIPDNTMYGWLEQRRILSMNVEENPTLVKETVVFGTASDKYPLYPDLLGFMPRRNISQEAPGWGGHAEKASTYAQRLHTLNPDRKKTFGQQLFFNPVGYEKNFLKNRWDDICEKCGLQMKHAPRRLMINRFISTHDDFILAYLNGSQGIPAGTKLEGNKSAEVNIPRPAHVTDHELYRAFAGKHRVEILEHMHFADEYLVFNAPSKANEKCYNPMQLLYHRQVGTRHEDDFVSPFNLDGNL